MTFSPDFEYFGKPKEISIQVTDDNNTPAIATYNVTVLRHQAAQQPSPAANSSDQGVIEESPAGETVIQQPVSHQQTQPVQQPQSQPQQTAPQQKVVVHQQTQPTTPQSQEVVVQLAPQGQSTAPQQQPQSVVQQPQATDNPQEVVVQEPASQVTVQPQQPVSQQQSQPVQQPQTQQQPAPQPQPAPAQQQSVQNVAEQVPNDASELPMLDDTNAWYMRAIALLGALSEGQE